MEHDTGRCESAKAGLPVLRRPQGRFALRDRLALPMCDVDQHACIAVTVGSFQIQLLFGRTWPPARVSRRISSISPQLDRLPRRR